MTLEKALSGRSNSRDGSTVSHSIQRIQTIRTQGQFTLFQFLPMAGTALMVYWTFMAMYHVTPGFPEYGCYSLAVLGLEFLVGLMSLTYLTDTSKQWEPGEKRLNWILFSLGFPAALFVMAFSMLIVGGCGPLAGSKQ